jgi:hypothetical protein
MQRTAARCSFIGTLAAELSALAHSDAVALLAENKAITATKKRHSVARRAGISGAG